MVITIPVCHFTGIVSDLHVTLKMHGSQDTNTKSRLLSISRRILSTPSALPPGSFLTTSATSAKVMEEPYPMSLDSASSLEDIVAGYRRSSVFFLRLNVVLRSGQQFPTKTKHNLRWGLHSHLNHQTFYQNFLEAN